MPNPDATVSSTHAAVSGWLTRRWRWLSAVAGLLLVYALSGFLLAPYLINHYAPQFVHDHLHRQLTLGKVQVNPFTLTLQIHQAKLVEANGALIGSVDYLLMNAELSSLLTRSYTFKKIQLDAPDVAVIVAADGHLNLNFSDPNAPAATSAKGELPAVRIGEFQLNKGRVHLEDLTRPKPFHADFTPIQFTLQNFRTEPRYDNAFHFSGRSAAGEGFDWQGEFTVQPFGSTGKLQLSNILATTLQNYLQDTLPLRLLSGALNLQGDYQLALNEAMQLQLNLPSIAVNDLQIAPLTADATPWITLPTVSVSNTQISLHERSIKVQQVKLSDASITAWLDEQRKLNLLQLKGPDTPASNAPWNTQVDDIVIDNATWQFEDRGVTPAARFKISPAQFQVQHFRSAADTTIDLHTTLHINDQAEFTASGSVAMDTLSTQLKLKLAHFPLVELQPYAATATDVVISSGQLNTDGDLYYKGNVTNKNPQLTFKGSVEIAELSTQDKAENLDFIKWQSLQLQNLQYSMTPDALDIAQIIARQAYGRVIIDSDGSTNIQQVLRVKPVVKTKDDDAAEKPTQPVAAKPTAPSMRIRVATVLVTDGAADFTDNTVKPAFSTGMQKLTGSIVGLSTANDSRARIKLDGSVDNYAPVSISGEANFLAAQTFSDVAMKFHNMELTTFNPYSGKFAGYNITKGKLSTELRYQIADRKLDAQHHIVIDQLEFGAATDSKEAVSLPIRLAVALLKDRNGVIDLNLPVSGSIDDPKFKVGPIIWKLFTGLLTKMVTAPFAALSSLFGGHSEDLAYVDFMPGSPVLNSSEADKLAKLAQALVERPQLKLNIPLTVITDADAAVMNDAAYARALNAVLPNAATAAPAQRLAALISLYQSTLKTAANFPAPGNAKADVTAEHIAYLETALKPQFAVSAGDRDALTRARADAVQAALLMNTDVLPEHVYLTARSNEVKSPQGVVRMELKLE
jgi:Domain of Unknown Function (DUF748)